MILRKKKTDAAKSAKGGSTAVNFAHYDVIVNPIVTEKSTRHTEQNKVMFNVARDANKEQIKSAVEALFSVQVTSVNTLVRKGKKRMFRGMPGQQQDKKKAIVTLAAGQNIDFSTGVK